MKFKKSLLALSTIIASTSSMAGGILYTHVDGKDVKPLLWDTSKGTIPVYVDGGEAFTFDYDGSVFLSIERANELTAKGFAEWSNVPTSTFKAEIAGTIESQIGIADINGKNAHELYAKENGYGFWVTYDTDGQILEDWFGVSKYSVLGIAFPEIATEDGEILEATALMNGFAVNVDDTNGDRIAGVFTHEFGHAINLSHAQANGSIAYESFIGREQWAGVPNCSNVEPLHSYQYIPYLKWYPDANPIDPSLTETMYPFIDTYSNIAHEMSTIENKDDEVAISNLYPTPEYLSQTGTIRGKVLLKDGKTEYPGLVITARNIENPLEDVVMVQSGDQTQGNIGIDGSYVIRGLTPGAEYYLYISQINNGGYPTRPSPIPGEAEYWNAGESNDPLIDSSCMFDTVSVAAGETVEDIDFVLNGHNDGVQFTPIVSSHMKSMSKNGRTVSGDHDELNFTWNVHDGFKVWEMEDVIGGGGAMNKTATKMAVYWDHNKDGIYEPSVLDMNSNKLELLAIPEGVTSCTSSWAGAPVTGSIWGMDELGDKVVGYIYNDKNGDGSCYSGGEIKAVVWDVAKGTASLLPDGQDANAWNWSRANSISGNGDTVVGSIGIWEALTWYKGELINHTKRNYDYSDAYAVSRDGRVSMSHWSDGTVLWNPETDTYSKLGGLENCVDVPVIRWGRDRCEGLSVEQAQQYYGKYASVSIYAMNDDATVLAGRGGSFRTGFYGAMYVAEANKWFNIKDFLLGQGVLEHKSYPVDNPYTLTAKGDKMLIGIAGTSFTGMLDLSSVFVCDSGKEKKVDFPSQFARELNNGAQSGRCEYIQ